MFKEGLLKEALRVYAGQHVLDRVLALGEKALALENGCEPMAVLYVIAAPNRKVFEELGPAQALARKVRFFTLTQEEVGRSHGRIADYLGDDAVAYFPAPGGEAAGAAAAVACAHNIVRRSLEGIDGGEGGGGAPLITPMIGIDFGPVFIGNFGTPERMKFTVQGDTVNQAGEIAAQCRKFQAMVLMGEAMANLLAPAGAAGEGYVGDAPSRGGAAPLRLYMPVEADFGAALQSQLEGR